MNEAIEIVKNLSDEVLAGPLEKILIRFNYDLLNRLTSEELIRITRVIDEARNNVLKKIH